MVWRSWVEYRPVTERLHVQFLLWVLPRLQVPWSRHMQSPIRAHTGGSQLMLLSCINVSPSFFPSPFLFF